MNLFPHIDLEGQLREITHLAAEGLALAYHADADGVISAALLAHITEGRIDGFAKVLTEQLSLKELSNWARQENVRNLATLDVNVWSTANGLSLLASSVPDILLVIDDHLGEVGQLPKNVKTVNLLPAGPRTDRQDQIRPTFLFADAVVRLQDERRSGFNSFLALAGMYGEGVNHLFSLDEIVATRVTMGLAEQFGRGLTSVFLLEETELDDDHVVRALIDLAVQGPSGESTDAAAQRAVESTAANELLQASKTVSSLVLEEVLRVDRAAPWLATEKFDVFLVELKSNARIVNIVASELRNRIRSGVTIALQERSHGCIIELRRTRDLNHPDLAQILLDMESSLFASRGGHPMAAGATVVDGKMEEFLGEFRDQMSSLGYSAKTE